MGALEKKFDAAMSDIYYHAKELAYYATYFKQMLDRYGGIETARRLLAESTPQQGLRRLWELDSLDISVEATVLGEESRPLFSAEELAEARRRLTELGHPVDGEARQTGPPFRGSPGPDRGNQDEDKRTA